MTVIEKEEILLAVARLLDSYIVNPALAAEVPSVSPSATDSVPEMLTIKECTEMFKGLTDNTLRQLIARKEITAVRTGEGKRGKILIAKQVLVNYLNGK